MNLGSVLSLDGSLNAGSMAGGLNDDPAMQRDAFDSLFEKAGQEESLTLVVDVLITMFLLVF